MERSFVTKQDQLIRVAAVGFYQICDRARLSCFLSFSLLSFFFFLFSFVSIFSKQWSLAEQRLLWAD